jgi:RNA polymerase sigma-70 factor (ECF subfamily)
MDNTDNTKTNNEQRLDNELLVLRSQLGEMEALSELITNWQRPLLYYVRRLMNEQDSYDVMQTVWLKVIRDIGKLREPKSFPAWIFRITRNSAFSHGKLVQALDEQLASEADICESSLNDLHQFVDAELVHQSLPKLKPRHREILTLFFLNELSIDEMAEVIDVPNGTVKSRLHFAKRELRMIIEKTGDKSV